MNEFLEILAQTIRTATFQPTRIHPWPERDSEPRTRVNRETRRPR